MSFIVKNLSGFSVREYELLDSTNEEAKRLISEKNITDKIIITANSQTNGRGRQGREWVSEEGNLFASYIFNISKEITPELYSYFCALAIARILQGYNLLPQLKWPNDILIKGSKICGILLEKHGDFLVCGIGININSSPDFLLDKKTTSLSDQDLKDQNINLTKDEILLNLTKNLEEILSDYKKNGFSSFEKEINYILLKGSAEIDIAGIKTKGEIISIDENGKMNFKTGQGIKKISSGEVFLI